ncbi:ESCRT-II complex component [Aureobasidium pullulans EXF-150]|uniref:ESCRT-II complex subunit VPS25 n=1 Tax=Aureobasidium pullulans EXF-150 TaxID=1043002 RepID=A0A074X2M0_AURPU|nr:ESCRT-II complex component [Aureobasidium pullulans EXF-150]KEQ79745.1 ESCRT-II complex component [Aureobasidium pullulans EXF-150]
MSTSPLPPTDTIATTDSFTYPPHHSFPPFYTLQPNQATLTRQLSLWSSLIRSHFSHHRTFKLPLSSAPTLPLFSNAKLNRSLDPLAIRQILDFMATSTPPTASYTSSDKTVAWIWWRTPSEWADKIASWVEETGQKGVVLTIYELRESDAVQGQEWVGMDEDMLRKVLDVLVKKGRCQVFGQVDGSGVKFF